MESAEFALTKISPGCRLSPVFSGWASRSLVRLYRARRGKALDRAGGAERSAIDRALRDPRTGGYYSLGCGNGSEMTDTVQSVDQAWMLQVQAMLAAERRRARPLALSVR